MAMLGQWLLVAVAIGIGWLLGRRSGSPSDSKPAGYPIQIPPGIRFTFENYSDDAIAHYVQSLAVGEETLPMHLSIASHFRRKGEVERAILIHQNLLASPSLDTDSREQATFELARDFMSAGLLDRAEALLKQLERSRLLASRSLELLLDIYQDEKEWASARAVALKLDYRRDTGVRRRLAHYCCEQALLARREGDLAGVARLLRDARGYDRDSVRVSLMMASSQREAGQYQEAITSLMRVEAQSSKFVPEIVPDLVDCYHALGRQAKLGMELKGLWARTRSTQVLLAYADGLARSEGEEAALALLAEQLAARPSLKGLDRMLALQLAAVSGKERPAFEAVRQVTERLLREKPRYLCRQCGFAGRTLIWLCPSCKQWETMQPVQGVEGD